MRPETLNPLFAETESLEGVGPKLKKPLEKLGPDAGQGPRRIICPTGSCSAARWPISTKPTSASRSWCR